MKKVVVTGGSGFVAGWVIVDFLQHDYEVATSLRSLGKADQVRAEIAKRVSPEQVKRLSFFEADLTSQSGWKEAIDGTDGVIHVASPLGNGTETAEELVAVAKNGVLNILSAAKAVGVSRVVMTSSQAVSTPMRDSKETLDESFWTDLKNPDLDPYRISKVEAETAAWQYARANEMKLTTVLPGAIFGPILSSHAISSDGILLQVLNGLPMIPKVPMEVSDVRDLAELHRLAFEQEIAVGKRYLAASQTIMFPEIGKLYQRNFPELHLTVRVMPNWATRLAARFMPALRSMVPMLGRQYRHTTAAAEHDLGWQQHTPTETLLDTGRSLIDAGLVKNQKAK